MLVNNNEVKTTFVTSSSSKKGIVSIYSLDCVETEKHTHN